jgi:hypothetical protein
MAKQQISNEDLVDALQGFDATAYDRVSSNGQKTMDAFFAKAEVGFNQRDLNAFIKNMYNDWDRMGRDGQHYFNILIGAKL